ncbi:hypothetical protein COU54_02755 [Candidatus Pacearchaeota archaeon CG10_big_fil_rev_8_21_14_0_10_31_24]|nr:MAG: hypothetical protein COU54_02755 [Candidatus Pacearchaeota archaeon CG10_big_fil_rev_8_21_14_0_10_31_24]
MEIPPRYGFSEWGDESEIFGKLVNGVILIEGGMGTAIEFSHIMKINEARIKNSNTLIYVSPINTRLNISEDISYCLADKPEVERFNWRESLTFEDLVGTMPVKSNVRSACLPNYEITTGSEAAKYLVEKLGLRKIETIINSPTI